MINKKKIDVALFVLLVLSNLPAACFAQDASPRVSWTLPYERNFWKYAGVNIGQSQFPPTCQYTSHPCQGNGHALGGVVGGSFSDHIGLELAYVNFGKIETAGGGTAGGKTSAYALNFSLVAGFPVTGNTVIFGKIGESWARTNVAGLAPGLITGNRTEAQPSWGAGIRLAFTPNWGLRLDADRYHLEFSDGARGTVYGYTVGLQYNFQ
jgi:hypothetical protein